MRAIMKKLLENQRVLLVTILVAGIVVGMLMSQVLFVKKQPDTDEAIHSHAEETEYSCSMHPQIRQMEPGKCPLCGMDLTPLGRKSDSNRMDDKFRLEISEEAMALANVRTTKVGTGSSQAQIQLSGKIQANQERMSTLTAKFGGRIESLYIGFDGVEIRKGQKIATIYAPDLATAHLELLEAAAQKESFPALYDAVVKKLKLWKLSEGQIEILESNQNFNYHFDVFSDTEGIVTERLVKVGDYISTGSQLASVIDLKSVWIVLEAYEKDLSRLKVGSKVNFQVNGLPGQNFKTSIAHINPTMDADSRTVEVRAIVPNQNYQLKPEMLVQAQVETNSIQDGVFVPKTAVLWTGTRSVVYVQTGNKPEFEMREVTIGQRNGENILVLEGLEKGELIVVNGVFAIDAAAQLRGNYNMIVRPQTKTLNVSPKFIEQITLLADSYFLLKNALVLDDFLQAKSTLTKLERSLEKIEKKHLDKEALERWNDLKNQFAVTLSDMNNANDLEELRRHFGIFSDVLIELTETFGLQKDKVYKQFCPMAFDDQGGYWLSDSEEILNPYFGEMMLSCGEVSKIYHQGKKTYEGESDPKRKASHQH